MQVKQFLTGGDRNFGYLAVDEVSGEAFIVDVSYDPRAIAAYAEKKGCSVRYLFSTHSHSDHTDGNGEFSRLTGLHPLLFGDVCPKSGIRVMDGAVFPLGSSVIRIFHTPGHTPDSICIHACDSLFTGDTLFAGKIGGTVSDKDAAAEYDSLHRLLKELPPDTSVYQGHDYGVRPISTLAEEAASNPFLLQKDFEAFLALKHNWAAYKKAHGIQ